MSYNKLFPASETAVRNFYCLFLYASFFLWQIIQVRRLNLNLRSSYLKSFKSSSLSHTLWVTLHFCDIASSLFKTVPSDFAGIFFNLNKVSIVESSMEIKFQEFKTYSKLKTLEWDILNNPDYLIWVSKEKRIYIREELTRKKCKTVVLFPCCGCTSHIYAI